MHELAIAQSIFDAVEAKADQCQASHIRSVHLQVGEASGIMPDALTSCFEMLTNTDPMTQGAQLQIDVMPHRALCRHCAKEFTVKQLVAQCPGCGQWSDEIISGTELRILEMEIDGIEAQH